MNQKEYPKVINYLEYDFTSQLGEINQEESVTVPGQAFTVKEVLLRFNNGTLPNIVQPVYHDDIEDFDNIDPTLDPAFDLVDAENILNDIKNNQTEREKINLKNSPEIKSQIESKKEQNNDEINNDEKSDV